MGGDLKSEGRNPKPEAPQLERPFGRSDFGILSDFGFRISSFNSFLSGFRDRDESWFHAPGDSSGRDRIGRTGKRTRASPRRRRGSGRSIARANPTRATASGQASVAAGPT